MGKGRGGSAAGAEIAVDPIDVWLAAVWVRLAAARWGLSTTEALVLLAALAGYTAGEQTAAAMGTSPLTVAHQRSSLYAKLDALALEQAVARVWTVYAPLRDEARRRAVAELGVVAA